MRFPNTGTGFEAEETRDFKILNGRVTMRNRAGSATGHAMQLAEFKSAACSKSPLSDAG